MSERIIISLTTWKKRIGNIPGVLDSIFNQTLPPDLVVINLAHDEIIPQNIKDYINNHNIEINRVQDTKVYKKIIPTLKKYPNDCIIAIDDDWLYPREMIKDFMDCHKKYPSHPISGNRFVMFGMQCHCGCASLTKAEFLGDYLDKIDSDVINNCPSDDLVYTFLSIKSGHPYIRTDFEYYTNMRPYHEENSYSQTVNPNQAIVWLNYLINRFGHLEHYSLFYNQDERNTQLIDDILKGTTMDDIKQLYAVYSSSSYRLGNLLIKPISIIKKYQQRFLKSNK